VNYRDANADRRNDAACW